jgi:hypothetical protein
LAGETQGGLKQSWGTPARPGVKVGLT